LYTVDLNAKTSSSVFVKNNEFTVDNIHVDNTGTIYAVSPGLFHQNRWSLITIDPQNGTITSAIPIETGPLLKSTYGGAVYNSIKDGKILYKFVWPETDDAPMLASIDLKTGKLIHVTDVNLGVNAVNKLSAIKAV